MTDNNYLSPNQGVTAASVSETSITTSVSSANKSPAQENVTAYRTGRFQRLFRQLWIMLRRNFILQVRYRKSTISQVFVGPFLFLLLLFVLQKADDNVRLKSNLHPLSYPLLGVQPCQGRTTSNPCINFMFTPNTPDSVRIMQTFADNNAKRTGKRLNIESIELGLDDKPQKTLDIVPVQDANFIYNYTLRHPNVTMFAIEFSPYPGPPQNYRYQIWYNATLMSNNSDIFGEQVLSFQRGIDEAIIAFATNDSNTALNVDLKDWPKVPPTQLNNQIVYSFGAPFFFCAEMIIFISILNTIVTEKELKLKDSLVMMGLKVEIYWISHFLSNACLIILCSLVTCVLGEIFGFFAFRNANFGVLFITFILFGLSMVTFAFFITTFCRRSRVAILVGILILIIGLLFQSFVFSNVYIGYIWWSKSVASAAWIVLMFLPFFNFGKFYLDLSNLTAGKLDQLTQTVIPGPGFHWSDLYNNVPSKYVLAYDSSGYKPTVPAPVQSWYFLMMNIVVFGLLTWYLDKIIPDEYGNYRNPLFFLTPSYYGFKFKKTTNLNAWMTKNKKIGKNHDGEDEDVANERLHAFDATQDFAIRICNLNKVYRKSLFVESKLDKVAVNDLCLTLKEGKCLALLGQNGAGKSTSINILSGVTPATRGDALLYGFSLKTEMGSIRNIMGVCPQHDILFNDLTAREHIELYAGIKNISPTEIEKLVNERLTAVRLNKVANKPAGSYSGGMKRRLSMLISTIGDPKIIFMDEPTTGMDPVNRRHVWSFIEKFKKGRVIILTTHSMEEADVLGDRICVMAHGKLRALGNTIHLKNKFGTGYRVSLVTNPLDSPRLKELIESKVPDVKLEDDSAGALIYELPMSSLPALPSLIKWLEENDEMSYADPGKKLVKAWGVSQKSLEEAFLRLIREANPKGYNVLDDTEGTGVKINGSSGLRQRNVSSSNS
ncbi:1192_t:CDS:2 [Acaulospora morrowiae]|uniref:1192_t:CDS:1 n=1 Tax=Acaulospora morrowiae TaxID=94023 RepID=A0A9N9A0E7_9GLOM|nr:1192_t:CDS:2 [Acaulospora morrowiae]